MHKPHMCLYSRLAGVHDAPVLIFRHKPHCLTVSKLQTMTLSLPLSSYVELYHPTRLPMNPSLSSQDSSSLLTLTDYTDQFIMSAQEHEEHFGVLPLCWPAQILLYHYSSDNQKLKNLQRTILFDIFSWLSFTNLSTYLLVLWSPLMQEISFQALRWSFYR